MPQGRPRVESLLLHLQAPHPGFQALQPDGVPEDVNLVDVLDLITDCVMAGIARSGSVYQITIPPEVLQRAFDNTVDLLKSQVVVTPD
jgi:hypothetical protein